MTKPTTKPSKATQRRDEMLAVIAAKHLNLTTLETRNSDGLDFSDQAVWSIKAALEAAYEAGAQAALAAAAGAEQKLIDWNEVERRITASRANALRRADAR